MDQVLQFAVGLPALYWSLLLEPSGWLGIFAAVGVVCLFAGVALASFRGNGRAILFLIPFALSEAVVIAFGLLYGEISSLASMLILLAFGVVTIWLVFRILAPAEEAPLEMWLLTIHTGAYAALASFVASTFVSYARMPDLRLIAVPPAALSSIGPIETAGAY